MPEAKRVRDVFTECFAEVNTLKTSITLESLKSATGELDLTPILNAFTQRIFPVIGPALEHLEKRIDDLEAKIPS